MPTGLKASWARLTGQYQRLSQQLDAEAKSCVARDRQEKQAQIDRHLAERQFFGRELDHLKAQRALTAEFLDRSKPKYQSDPRQPLVIPREVVPFTPAQLKRRPGLILTHLSDKQARFSRNDIMRGLAEFISDPLELRLAADKALAASDLVSLNSKGKDEFTTRDYQTAEQSLAGRIKDMAQSGGFKVATRHIDKAISRQNAALNRQVGAKLSDEQVAAIQHVLAPNQLTTVVGLAGAGKSTMLSAACEAWERQGLRVHGAALAGKAADSLQTASGIPSRTLASLEASWKSGYEPVACGDVVVIDEAGMVGTRQLNRVAKELQQRGCKLVLVGDPDQLQPIEAGTPFRGICEIVGSAHLTEIRRQKSEWQRQASRDLADGHTDIALQTYADQGAVHDTQDRGQAIVVLVENYISDDAKSETDKSLLALAHRRIDVHAINQAIRAARKIRGEGIMETLFETDNGPRAFAVNDRILFTRNDKTLGVRNGLLGTVEDVGSKKLTVSFDPDEMGSRRRLTFSPAIFPSIDHGFAVSIHRSQGCTVDKSYVLSSRTMDENLTYVAMTRHKEEARFFTAPEIAPKRLGRESEIFAPRDFRAKVPVRSR